MSTSMLQSSEVQEDPCTNTTLSKYTPSSVPADPKFPHALYHFMKTLRTMKNLAFFVLSLFSSISSLDHQEDVAVSPQIRV